MNSEASFSSFVIPSVCSSRYCGRLFSPNLPASIPVQMAAIESTSPPRFIACFSPVNASGECLIMYSEDMLVLIEAQGNPYRFFPLAVK